MTEYWNEPRMRLTPRLAAAFRLALKGRLPLGTALEATGARHRRTTGGGGQPVQSSYTHPYVARIDVVTVPGGRPGPGSGFGSPGVPAPIVEEF